MGGLAFAQSKRLIEVAKEYVTQDIPVTDGMIYKYKIPTDTARYFSAGADVYDVEVKFIKRGGGPVDPTTEKIDGEKASFSANWSNHSPNANWSGGTIAFSNAAGSTATYTFTGTKVELWAERLASHGTGTIKIDTSAEVPVAFNTTPLGLPVKIYESATLPLGSHTIVLKCVSGYVLLDYFIVHK